MRRTRQMDAPHFLFVILSEQLQANKHVQIVSHMNYLENMNVNLCFVNVKFRFMNAKHWFVKTKQRYMVLVLGGG